MLAMHIDGGKFGRNVYHQWRDGEPVPVELADAKVVQFTADGRELELVVHALNGDTEYVAPAGLPRFVQLCAVGDTVAALDAEGAAWYLESAGRQWRRLAVFES